MKKVTVILPSHNEEKIIKKAVTSLLNQTFCNIEIVVALDNCTDRTQKIVVDSFRGNPKVRVFKSKNNRHKKAGVLNQLFRLYFDKMGDYILVMDADTILDHRAILEGVKFLELYKDHGAVCSRAGILNSGKRNMLWCFQNIEYGFGDTSFVESFGNVFVCRGMYSMYTKKALKNVLQRGFIYDISSITEDYELTLELKKKGYKISSYNNIKAYTDVPLKLKEFWVQRVRWLKGGLEDLKKHGLKKYTKTDVFEALFNRAIILIQIFFIIEAVKVRSVNIYFLSLIIGVYLLNAAIRFKYVQHKSFKTYMLVFTVFPMLFYSWLNALLMLYTTILALFKINIKWR